jgi:hypothetical protein
VPLSFSGVQMKLVWNLTGDSLSIDPTNPQLMEYWLGQLSHDNIVNFAHNGRCPQYRLDKFSQYVQEVNQFLAKTGMQLPDHEDWLNQDNLNDIHRTYVKHQRGRNVVELMRMIGGDPAVHCYRQVNQIIHETERTVQYQYTGSDHWSCPNIFGTDVLMFGRWHVELKYESLGRSTYEKWLNYDTNLKDDDTDDFEHLGSALEFNIGMPLQHRPPVEYVIACANAWLPTVGQTLPIGNFIEDIGTVRLLFYRNASTTNNTISFVQ